MTQEFLQSSLPVEFATKMQNVYNYDILPKDAHPIYGALFKTMAIVLKKLKTVGQKTAFVVRNEIKKDANGNQTNKPIAIAGIIDYHKNEDPTREDNWSYANTFNEEDLEGANVYEIGGKSDYADFYTQLDKTGRADYRLIVHSPTFALDFFRVAIECIIEWLDVNVKEGEDAVITLPGHFVAVASIVNGVKQFAITPDDQMKRLIKDDDALTK